MAITKNTGDILDKLQKGLGPDAAVEIQQTKELVDRLYTFKKFNSLQPQKSPASTTKMPVVTNNGEKNTTDLVNDMKSALKQAGLEAAAPKAPRAGFFGGKTVEPTTKTPTTETPKAVLGK